MKAHSRRYRVNKSFRWNFFCTFVLIVKQVHLGEKNRKTAKYFIHFSSDLSITQFHQFKSNESITLQNLITMFCHKFLSSYLSDVDAHFSHFCSPFFHSLLSNDRAQAGKVKIVINYIQCYSTIRNQASICSHAGAHMRSHDN